MKFLIDENVNHGLLPFLKELQHEAMLSPKELSNGDVLAMAISSGCILLTHDKDFLNKQIVVEHPGIVLIRIVPEKFEILKTSLKNLLSEKSSANIFVDKLFLLFESRYEEIPFRWGENLS